MVSQQGVFEILIFIIRQAHYSSNHTWDKFKPARFSFKNGGNGKQLDHPLSFHMMFSVVDDFSNYFCEFCREWVLTDADIGDDLSGFAFNDHMPGDVAVLEQN